MAVGSLKEKVDVKSGPDPRIVVMRPHLDYLALIQTVGRGMGLAVSYRLNKDNKSIACVAIDFSNEKSPEEFDRRVVEGWKIIHKREKQPESLTPWQLIFLRTFDSNEAHLRSELGQPSRGVRRPGSPGNSPNLLRR